MTERIRWNDDECDRLLAAALPLLVADQKLSIVEAVRKVQDTVISQDRRRNLVNIGAVPVELRTRLQNRRDAASGAAGVVPAHDLDLMTTRAVNAEAAALAADARVVELEAQVESLKAHILTLEAHPAPTELHVLEGFCTRVLANALALGKELPGVRLEHHVRPPALDLGSVVKSNGAGNGKHDPEPKGADAPKLPVILVCGLKPDQRAHFESTFKNEARMKFWYQDNGQHRENELSEKAKGADMVYLMMGACSHAAVAAVARVNDNYQRVADYRRDTLRDMMQNFLDRRAQGKNPS